MMELSDYRRGLFQWDTGRSLIVTEKDITEVHFQLLPPPSGSTETTDVPVTDGVAHIPDDLLQVGLPLRAYAWGEGYSHYDQTLCHKKGKADRVCVHACRRDHAGKRASKTASGNRRENPNAGRRQHWRRAEKDG